MNSTAASEGILERLVSTGGIMVRRSEQDAPYWSASGRPVPFDIHTVNIAGARVSGEMLARITDTLNAERSGDDKQQQIWHLVINAVNRDPEYKKVIDLLAGMLLASIDGKPDVISGGEPRDWFFSIPLAAVLQVPHVFLLKSGGVWHSNEYGEPIFNTLAGKKVLHVTDMLGLGSNYTEHWLPILRRLKAEITKTFAIVVRDMTGVQVLAEAGVEVYSQVVVDRNLFEEIYRLGLIPQFAHEEIAQYYTSPQEWMERVAGECDGE